MAFPANSGECNAARLASRSYFLETGWVWSMRSLCPGRASRRASDATRFLAATQSAIRGYE
jgi:hypothetical protein